MEMDKVELRGYPETFLAKHTNHQVHVSASPPTLGSDDTLRARHADCADADVSRALED
jgi:hypothetical protein